MICCGGTARRPTWATRPIDKGMLDVRRFACAVSIAGLALAAPAIALPNVFWTFGWGVPGRSKPWTIGRAEERRAIRMAAREKAAAEKAAGSVPVFAYAPMPPVTPVFAIEPVSATILAGVAQGARTFAAAEVATSDRPADPVASSAEPIRPLPYDLAGL